jgi:hypothetical protein
LSNQTRSRTPLRRNRVVYIRDTLAEPHQQDQEPNKSCKKSKFSVQSSTIAVVYPPVKNPTLPSHPQAASIPGPLNTLGPTPNTCRKITREYTMQKTTVMAREVATTPPITGDGDVRTTFNELSGSLLVSVKTIISTDARKGRCSRDRPYSGLIDWSVHTMSP